MPASSDRTYRGAVVSGTAQRPAGPLRPRQLDVGRLDGDLLVGPDPGDLEGEDVGGLAGGQGGLPALLLGPVVVGLGLLAFLQLGADLGVAEADADGGDGGVAGQREAVGGLQHPVALLGGVAEDLRQPQGGQRAGHLAAQLGAPQGDEPPGLPGVAVADDLQDAEAVGARVLVGARVEHGRSSAGSGPSAGRRRGDRATHAVGPALARTPPHPAEGRSGRPGSRRSRARPRPGRQAGPERDREWPRSGP